MAAGIEAMRLPKASEAYWRVVEAALTQRLPTSKSRTSLGAAGGYDPGAPRRFRLTC